MKARILLALSALAVVTVSGCATSVSGTAAPAGVAGTETGVDGPVEPTTPVEPSGIDPVEPSQPVEPSGVEPVEPSEPSESGGVEPVEPVEPSDPVEPSEPSEPVEPSEPSEPVEPTAPTEPAEPTAPTDGDGPSTGNMQACVAAGQIIQNITPLMSKIQDGSLTQADVDEAFPADEINGLPAELAGPINEIRDLFTQMIGKSLTDVVPLLNEVSTKLQTLATSTLQEVCTA